MKLLKVFNNYYTGGKKSVKILPVQVRDCFVAPAYSISFLRLTKVTCV
jgi:hypothetical protein